MGAEDAAAAAAHGGQRLGSLLVAGVLGQLTVALLRSRPLRAGARAAAVGVVAGGLVTRRRVEEVAENARLWSGDVVADAYQSLGEQAPAPATPAAGAADDHPHAH